MNSKEALNRLKESAHALEELPASNWVDYYGEKGHLIDNETELELKRPSISLLKRWVLK